jgi:transposase
MGKSKSRWVREDERKIIAEAICLGAPVQYVATRHKVTIKTVYNIIKEYGVKPNGERVYALGRAARDRGMTINDILNWKKQC